MALGRTHFTVPAFRIAGLLLFLATLISARKPDPEVDLDLTTVQWREDLKAFASELPKRHMNAFHHVSREVFEREVARLDAEIPSLDGPGVVVRLARIAAMIGDGHTSVHLPSPFRVYPVGIKRFDADFRVIRTTGPADSALGMKLVAIGDTPVEKIAAIVDSLMAQDEHPGLRDAQVPTLMVQEGVLRGLGVVRDPQRASFAFEDDHGARRTLTLAPLSSGSEATWKITSPQAPLYRARRAEPFFFTWLPESRTVYCNWRSYDGLGGRSKEFWEFVDQHPTDRVVIDLRQNGGGDFFVGRKNMVEPVLKRPALNQKGHLFVVISPITFSAALANACDFRTKTNAMLVGEPIGEKPNSYSENDEFRLPNSRLTVSYSTKFYEFMPGQEVIAPDQLIAPTWEEFRAGRDPVLEWIVRCCR